MTRTNITMATLLLGASVAAPAAGHVVLSEPQAAGGAYTAYFRVGHGCAGSATTSLRIEIPPEVSGVRPQPKPGWTVKIERQPLPTPVKGEGGRMVSDRVAAIIWAGGPLPDDQWDEFGISAQLPAKPGPIYFPAVQTCEQGEEHWAETPKPGAVSRLQHPAPTVTVTLKPPPGKADPMAGMKM